MNGVVAGSPDALLRQADWRFLLPRPRAGAFEHLALWGGSAPLAARWVQAGVARRISLQPAGPVAADAAVVLHGQGGAPELERITASLAPDGMVYCEVDRRTARAELRLSPGALDARLAAAGLTMLDSYWVRPGFHRRQLYVPLAPHGPLEWYVRTSSAATTRGEWARLLALRAALRLSRRAALRWFRRYAFTAVAGPRPSAPLAPLAQDALAEVLVEPTLHAVLVTNGSDDLDRVVVLPFARGDVEPRAVVKFPRLASRNFLVRAEQEALRELHSVLCPELSDALPVPLGAGVWGDFTLGVESYVRGRVLSAVTRDWLVPRRRKLADLRLAADWLTEFNLRAQVERRVWTPVEWDDRVAEPIRAYSAAYGLNADENSLFGLLNAQGRALLGTPLPIVWQHYAYAPWNLARAGGRLRVFDWEGAGPGLPLFDLLYFAMHWYEDVQAARAELARLRAFRGLFCEPAAPGSIPAAVRSTVDGYVARLGLHPAYRPVALTLLVLTRALSTYERGGATGSRTPRADNPRVAYLAALAECREPLFAAGTGRGADG